MPTTPARMTHDYVRHGSSARIRPSLVFVSVVHTRCQPLASACLPVFTMGNMASVENCLRCSATDDG
jgi:hypothetical protein